MIKDEIEHYIDWEQWDSVKVEEKEMKAKLRKIDQRWDEIKPIIERK